MDNERREFRFPLSDINDLKVSSNDYHVEVTSTEDPVQRPEGRQKDIIQEIEDRTVHDPLALYKHENFDPLYMFVCKLKDLKASVKEELVRVLAKCASLLLAVTRESVGTPNAHRCRNGIKMCSYLLCVIVRTIERGLKAAPTQPKKKKGRSRPSAPQYDWSSDKEKIFGILADILSNEHVTNLWDMNAVEEEFGNLFFNTAMSAMENQENHQASSRAITDSMYRVIGLSLSSFRCNAHAPSQLIRFMQSTGHWSTELKQAQAVASLVKHVVDEHEYTSLLHNILAEISALDGRDLARDSRGTRVLSIFLKEIAERKPTVVLSKLSSLLRHLEQEPYMMRNGVVSMIGVLIQHAFEDDSAENRDARHRQRHRLFDLLEARVWDTSSYTRSRVLQTWTELVRARLVPAKRICSKLICMGRDRLFDKSSSVRSRAIQMLKVIIENNPWGTHELVQDKVEEELKKLMDEVERIEQSLNEQELRQAKRVLKAAGIEDLDVVERKEEKSSDDENENEDEGEDGKDAEEKDAGSDIEMEDVSDAAANEVETEIDDEDEEVKIDENMLDELKTKRKHLMGLVMLSQFTTHMSECVERVSQLLSSKTKSDVLECIQFFEVACQHKIGNEAMGFKKMLPLVWNKDNSDIRLAVLRSYHFKYIRTNDLSQMPEAEKSKHALSVAASLVKMANGSTLAEITCIEELVRQLVAEKEDVKFADVTIPDYVFSALWGIFEGKLRDVTIEQRRGALDLLRMAAMARPSIISRKVSKVVEIGLGDIAEGDCGMARSACMALQSTQTDQTDANGRSLSCTIPDDLLALIWDKTQYLLRGGFIQSKHWFATAQEAINLIFALHPSPDQFISLIVRDIARNLFVSKQSLEDIAEGSEEDTDDEMKMDTDSKTEEPSATEARSPANGSDGNGLLYRRYALAKFLFILGNVAIKLLVHIEKKEAELKKMRSEREQKMNGDDENDDELNETLGGAGVEEYEIEQMKQRAETSLVSGDTLLGKFVPLILRIVTEPVKYSCPILQNSAVLAFCKYMCICPKFCERNLRSLFVLLMNHTNASIRANIIIALGDMAFRFPNELDPWAEKLYENLRDDNILVRKNTLMVLTHLILNDMIKVRDSICGIALLLLDEVGPIRDLARLFFQELSKKGKNPIYNILPDTISRLSKNDDVSEDTFKHVMKFLLGFIDKDRQKENLVEKFCKRFSTADADEQGRKVWRNIAFCLSQLQYSERLVKKITDDELFKHYSDKLHEDGVEQYFRDIVSKCKKHVKPDFKETFDQWVEAMDKCKSSAKEDAAADARGVKKLARSGRKRTESREESSDAPPKKKRRVTRRKGGRRARVRVESSSSEDEDDFEFAETDSDEGGNGRGRKNVSAVDSENEVNENNPPQSNRPKRNPRRRPGRKPTRGGKRVNPGKRGLSSSSEDDSGLEIDTDSD